MSIDHTNPKIYDCEKPICMARMDALRDELDAVTRELSEAKHAKATAECERDEALANWSESQLRCNAERKERQRNSKWSSRWKRAAKRQVLITNVHKREAERYRNEVKELEKDLDDFLQAEVDKMPLELQRETADHMRSLFKSAQLKVERDTLRSQLQLAKEWLEADTRIPCASSQDWQDEYVHQAREAREKFRKAITNEY